MITLALCLSLVRLLVITLTLALSEQLAILSTPMSIDPVITVTLAPQIFLAALTALIISVTLQLFTTPRL